MNKKFFLSMLFFIPFLAQSNNERVLLAGSIQFPTTMTKAPSLKVFYQGYKYTVDVSPDAQYGRFELYTDHLFDELYIIITESLQIPDKNNFAHFKTSRDVAYRLFKLTKAIVPTETKSETLQYTWHIQEIFPREKEIIIPDNTVIFFMPPALIAGLEENPWSENHHIMRLPRIVFHDKITQDQLQEAATRMTLALLDFELFHAQLPTRLMITDNRIVAMPYVQHSTRA